MKIGTIEAIVVKAPVPGIETWQAASFAVPFRWAESTLVKVTAEIGRAHV